MYLHSRVHVQKMSPEGANMNSHRWSEAEPGVGSKRMRGPRRGPTKTSNRERRPHRVRFCTERGLPSRSVISHDESGDTIPITATVTLNRGTQYRLLLLSHCRPYFHPSLDLCPAFPDALSGLRGPNGLVTQGFALGYIPPDPSGRMAPGRVHRWQGQTYTIHLSLTSSCGFIAGDTNHIVQRVPADRLDLPPVD